ncbi:sensor histidine kinase [Halovenus rubra]|uniref:histidine kinase n=2 Tax=Halovenus rubra TaxID=869890 RepID=A0ABD5X7T8_9EURY|nr:HAMP domain-containing sensor histidine kinase [Halovenus rubra]
MATRLDGVQVGDWSHYSVSIIGALLLTIGVILTLIDRQLTAVEGVRLIGVGVPAVALLGLGSRLATTVRNGSELARVLGWTGLGSITAVAFGGWLMISSENAIEIGLQTGVGGLSVLTIGALFGATIGYYSVQARTVVKQHSDKPTQRPFLEEQQEALYSLNRIFRHQLLNDLSAISGQSELLAADKVETATATESITRHAREMESTVDRFEPIMEVLTTVQTRTDIPVADVIETARNDAQECTSNLSIQWKGSTDTTVRADELLSNALTELFVNVAKHGSETATVTTNDIGQEVVIEVSDTGPGLASSPPEAAFDASNRGPDSDGEGLGLFLVDLIVSRYDGDVQITEADDGTTVKITVPTHDHIRENE